MKDKFLSRPVIRCGTQIITVKDLIKHAARIQGAVHCGKPENEGDEALKQFAKFLRIGNLPAGLHQLLVIGRIVRKTLEPLRSAIQKEIYYNSSKLVTKQNIIPRYVIDISRGNLQRRKQS
jgi:hypothetical protein